MTDWDALFADRRFPELMQDARAALRRRLALSGQDRPITPDEEAVLAAGALLIDGFYDRLGQVGRDLRKPLEELVGVRPRGSQAARTWIRFSFENPIDEPFELPAGLEIAGQDLDMLFTTVESARVTPTGRAEPAAEAVVAAVHARRIADEPLGVGDGTAGQSFRLRHRPTAVLGCDPIVQISAGAGWADWIALELPNPGEQQVLFDLAAAEVRFPPGVRLTPETLVRIRGYWVGGGAAGNQPAGVLTELRSVLPGAKPRVVNIEAARGGRDAESPDAVWGRVSGALRMGDRAVTAADHEELSLRADPSLARVRCLVDEGGGIRVLLLAQPPPRREQRPTIDDLNPSADTLARVAAFLEQRRLLGARLFVEPPAYQGVSVTATITAADRVRETALEALYAYLHPITGGECGAGWPIGHAVNEKMIKKLLFGLPGVHDVTRVSLSRVDLRDGTRGPERPLLEIGPAALPLSVEHRIETAGN